MMQSRPTDNWWTRRCGGRDVMRIALPLIVSTSSWTVMNFIDRMFLMWHSVDSMAAAMPAGMVHFSLLCFPMVVAAYVNTFVAQYHGAGRPERIGLAVGQGLRIGLVAMPLMLATIPLAPMLFQWVGHDSGVMRQEVIYYRTLTYGAGAVVFSSSLTAFFTGRGATSVVMVVDVGAALLNVVLDYLLIFGHAGFPELGIAGAAWATVTSLWVKTLVYWLLMNRRVYRQRYRIADVRRLDPDLMRRLWRYGGPNGLQMTIEVTAFTVFLLILGRLGPDVLTATNLTFNLNSLAFVPLLGLGMAVAVMVGHQLGDDRPELAARATWTALVMALTYVGCMATLYLTIPEMLLVGHAANTAPEDFDRISRLSVVLLRFAAVFCLFDAMHVVFVGALKGAGDTRFILATSIVLSPVPVLLGWLGITYWKCGIYYCWTIITTWICLLGAIFLVRFLLGRWRSMRVIEAEAPIETSTPLAETEAPTQVV